MAFARGSTDKGSSEKSGVSGSLSGLPEGSGRNGQAAFLGSGSKVVGKLNFTGPAVLSGQIEGEIKADNRLEVGESAVIKAKIEGVDIIVRGTIEGDVVANSKLELYRSGKITGNVSCASLHIEDGAVFEGSCQMINRTARSASSGTTATPSTSSSAPGASTSSGDAKSVQSKNGT